MTEIRRKNGKLATAALQNLAKDSITGAELTAVYDCLAMLTMYGEDKRCHRATATRYHRADVVADAQVLDDLGINRAAALLDLELRMRAHRVLEALCARPRHRGDRPHLRTLQGAACGGRGGVPMWEETWRHCATTTRVSAPTQVARPRPPGWGRCRTPGGVEAVTQASVENKEAVAEPQGQGAESYVEEDEDDDDDDDEEEEEKEEDDDDG